MTVLLRRGACFSIRTDSSLVYALTSSSRFDEFRLSLKTDDEEISCLNESTSIARSFLKVDRILFCQSPVLSRHPVCDHEHGLAHLHVAACHRILKCYQK